MKMKLGTPLDVHLQWDDDHSQKVGRLAYRDRRAYLEFADEFLRSGLEISPVHHEADPDLVKPYAPTVFEGLHGVFNDSLPDGWGRLLLDRRARQLGIEPSTMTPLDRLACVGSTGIGALCYSPAQNPWGTSVDELELDQLAADARLVLDGEVGDLISTFGQAGGSSGGARPKLLIAINKVDHAIHGAADIPAGYEHWLVKFPGHDDPVDIAAIEMAYSQMAKAAGVAMEETRLLPGKQGTGKKGSRSKAAKYFATRRFDRVGSRRVHVHSASGLLYADFRMPLLDYKDLILLTKFVTRDQRQCKIMYRLAVFNVLSHNRDDHARQFSYTMDSDGCWRFAPAYDLTWSEGWGGEHSTAVLGHGRDISKSDLINLGKQADLKENESTEIIEEVATAVADWRLFAKESEVSRGSTARIAKSLNNLRV